MDPYWSALIAIAVLGLFAGLIGPWYRVAPWIASAIILLAILTWVATVGVWASRCWNCSGDGEIARGGWFYITAIFAFAATWALVTIVWMSFAASFAIREFLRWVRSDVSAWTNLKGER